jgi:hypothetical protein
MSDLTSPISSYALPGESKSGLIADNCLFLGSSNNIIIYEISPSLTEPLKKLASIGTKSEVNKMIKVGQELVLGEDRGYLEIFDIKNNSISHT